MVIGHGMMAKAFEKYNENEDIIVFASGVSNSIETDKRKFEREKKLLSEIVLNHPKKVLVYFSTVSISDKVVKERPYVMHKLAMEQLIKENAKRFLILRISNVVGPNGNPNTIMNYLVNKVIKGEIIQVWKYTERNLIDVEDVRFIVDELLKRSDYQSRITNLAMRSSTSIIDIIQVIESFIGKSAHIEIVDKGNSLDIDTAFISEYLDKLETVKGSGLNYISNLLKKYY